MDGVDQDSDARMQISRQPSRASSTNDMQFEFFKAPAPVVRQAGGGAAGAAAGTAAGEAGRVNGGSVAASPVARLLVQDATAADLVPARSRVVVLDSALSLLVALRVVGEEGFHHALVWDDEAKSNVAVLDPTHFAQILAKCAATARKENQSVRRLLEARTIADFCRLAPTPRAPMRMAASRPLAEFFRAAGSTRPLRLCITDGDGPCASVLSVADARSAVSWVFARLVAAAGTGGADARAVDGTGLLTTPIANVGVGTWGSDIKSVRPEAPLVSVLASVATMKEAPVVPVTDAKGILVNAFSARDLRFVVVEGGTSRGGLDGISSLTVAESVKGRERERSVPVCTRMETLGAAAARLCASGAHAIMVLGKGKVLEGVVTVADMLKLVLAGGVRSKDSS